MQNHPKRGLHTLPFKYGHDNAVRSTEGLAKFLNARRGAKGFDRVERLIWAANEIDRVVRKAGYPKSAYADIYEGRFGKEVKRSKEEIDHFMHELRPVVALGEPRVDGWSLCEVFSRVHPPAEQREMYLAAILVLQAATSGDLRLITQCNDCGHWFVRARDDHKFCSGLCREKSFRSTDTGKAKRRAYMQGYRARLKRRDLANLRNARGKR